MIRLWSQKNTPNSYPSTVMKMLDVALARHVLRHCTHVPGATAEGREGSVVSAAALIHGEDAEQSNARDLCPLSLFFNIFLSYIVWLLVLRFGARRQERAQARDCRR